MYKPLLSRQAYSRRPETQEEARLQLIEIYEDLFDEAKTTSTKFFVLQGIFWILLFVIALGRRGDRHLTDTLITINSISGVVFLERAIHYSRASRELERMANRARNRGYEATSPR